MIDGQNFFDQPVKNNLGKYDNIWKMAVDQGDGYTAGCLLNYTYFKECYKIIEIDLSKQQALNADPKATHQINFTATLYWDRDATMFFIIEEAKETILDF